MWRCVIGLWSHQSCANRLAGKHVSLSGGWGECVCVVWITDVRLCGKWFDGAKPILMENRWGQLTLSQTNYVVASARLERLQLLLWLRSHTGILDTDTLIHGTDFSMLHLRSVNWIMFALYSYIPEVHCGLGILEDTNRGFFHEELPHRCTHWTDDGCVNCFITLKTLTASVLPRNVNI